MLNFYPACSSMRVNLLNKSGLPSVLLLCGILLPTAQAVTLGDITVSSAVGEHFQASIPVRDIDSAALSSLQVSVADESLSKAAGLTQSDNLPFLWAELRRPEGGEPVVVLLSGKPMPNEYNEIIVELAWSGGSYLREYIIRPPANGVASINQPALETTTASNKTADVAPVASNELPSITVKKGDTLLSIARDLELPQESASQGYTTEQLMRAIYRSNPAAFLGSPDRLRAGAKLRVPGSDDLRAAVTPDTDDFFAQSTAKPAASAATRQASATPTAEPVSAVATPGVSVDSSQAVAAIVSSSGATNTTGSLSTEQANDLVNDAVAGKLEPIDATLTKLDQQIDGIDRTLSTLGQSLADQKEQMTEMETRIVALATSTPELTTGPVVAQPSVATVSNALTGQKESVSAKSIWSTVVSSSYLRSLGLLGIALGLAFILVLGQLLARRKADKTKTNSSREDSATENSVEATVPDVNLAEDQAHREIEVATSLTWFKRHLTSNKVSDEALQEALARHPQRQDIRLRLLKRYAKRRDVQSFTELGREMYLISRGRNPEWAGVLQLALTLESDMSDTASTDEHSLTSDLTGVIYDSGTAQSEKGRRRARRADVEPV